MGLLKDLFTTDRQPANITAGVLTGVEIARQVSLGRISISDYTEKKLNPNSYNLSCGNTVTIYQEVTVMDLRNPETYSKTATFEIDPSEGFICRPGQLYLIPTAEIIKTNYYEPIITGRSSIGRLGIAIHQEAGFGDIGFDGKWTLQIKVTYPTKIYPNMQIAQVYFLTPCGDLSMLYHGKYQGARGAISSKWV